MDIGEKLKIFRSAGLGLPDDRLQLKPHDPQWLTVAKDEIYGLISLLPSLHHVGSTAVPELAAKPILDLIGGTENLTKLDEQNHLLQEQGYTPMGEFGIEGRRFFKFAHEDTTYIHLHVFQNTHPKIAEHIAFRDELIANPLARSTYENIKRQLEKSCTRQAYSEAKNEIISRIQPKKS
ncbi:MAG: GrpB family protein [Proteobacteria bacterium]|nr:MAG: GrpB family protein [Pseudomonadota bacterium]